MAVIDNAYNYYMATYGQSLTPSRYDSHKKSDLRNVYNSILKANTESPVYKLSDPDEAQRFAIDVKESSRQIQNVVSSMSNDFQDSSSASSFKTHIAYSSDESSVSVNYVPNDQADSSAPMSEFTIDVNQLAQPQINTGNFLDNAAQDLEPGEYTFDLSANQTVFEFQFTVKPEDTNFGIHSKLADLINSANLGLTASVVENATKQSTVQIRSQQTGLMPNEDALFTVSADNTFNSIKAIQTLGLDQVSQEAANSSFLLNGSEHSSYSNSFTINKAFEINLNNVSDGAVTIGFKSDAEAIADNVTKLADAYNSMVDVAQKYSTVGVDSQMNKLNNIIQDITDRFRNELEPIGLTMEEDGHISVDKALLTDASEQTNWPDTGERLNHFKNTISRLATRTSINPMDYVDKKICAYKNPGRTFRAPYATSQYSGMLFNATR